jgi:hypothetical protein
MEGFRKTIHGVDFAFDLQEGPGEYYYLVEAENIKFELHIKEDGRWTILKPVPIWIKDLEDALGAAIHEHDA